MKLISAILSIYLLGLALIPCADGAEWCVFDLEETLEIEWHETDDHDHKEDCGDHCSPLCFCSCCHITVRPPITAQLEIVPPVFQPYHPEVVSISLNDLLLSHEIWQPPRKR